MAVTKVSLDTSASGQCIAIYNALSAIGLASDPIGSITNINAVFASPLVASGYYIRVRKSLTGNNYPFCLEIGTVSGTTFTVVSSVITYLNVSATGGSYLYLLYDTTAPWIVLTSNCGAGLGQSVYLGKLNGGTKIGFSAVNDSRSIGAVVNLDTVAALGGLHTFHRSACYNSQYLEQTLKVIDAGGNIMMNGANPDYVVGVTSVAITANSAVPYTEVGGSALFCGTYITSAAVQDQLNTYLKITL